MLLTVFQSLPVDGIVTVSAPQELVAMIVGKAVNLAHDMDVEVLGLVENMAYFKCCLLYTSRRTHRGGSGPDRADAAVIIHGNGHILLRLHIARAVEQHRVREYVRHGIPLYLPAPMRGHGAESMIRAYQELGKASRENAHMRKSYRG